MCGGPPNAVPTAAACSVCRRLLRCHAHAAEGRSPELALGLDIVLRPDLHAVDGRGGLMLGRQVAPDHLVLVPLESALRRAQNSASSMRVAPMQQGRLHLLRGRRAACVTTSAAYLHHFRPSAGERGRGRGRGGNDQAKCGSPPPSHFAILAPSCEQEHAALYAVPCLWPCFTPVKKLLWM